MSFDVRTELEKFWPPRAGVAELRKFWPPQAGVQELKKRLQPQALVALSLESRRLVVELVRREGEPGRPWSTELPLGAEAVLADPEAAGASLLAALAQGNIREHRFAVCVPPSWALATSMDIPAMSGEDLRGFLELRAEREFPIAPGELRLGFNAFEPAPGSVRATLAALPLKKLRVVERLLEAAGGRASSVSLGLVRCLGPGEPGAVHVLANCDRVDVVITAGGGIAALRSLAGAAGEESFDAAAFCREVRITLGRLPEPLRREVREAHFGGVPATAEALRQRTSEQFLRMGVAPLRSPREELPAAREAARHLLRGETMPFEFIIPEVNKWERALARLEKPRHRQLLGAGLAALALLAGAFFWRAHTLSSLQEEWNSMRRNVGELETLQKKNRQFRPWFTAAPEALPMMETLVEAFPETGEVWAKSIQVSDASKVTCTGFARNRATLEALRERLRKVPGVSRVEMQQQRGENPVEFAFTFQTEGRP